ncbi:MAG: hypothetical protein LBE13_17250 [Bacteroidales bacterium]|nr:hypothetical protein [Bacteroidales bacterium]
MVATDCFVATLLAMTEARSRKQSVADNAVIANCEARRTSLRTARYEAGSNPQPTTH